MHAGKFEAAVHAGRENHAVSLGTEHSIADDPRVHPYELTVPQVQSTELEG